MKRKFSLIAVAKDEGAYIHEWIYHHLYMGFDEIYIGVNRTSDNTVDILDKISTVNSKVKYEIIDWIDQSEIGESLAIQRIAYSYFANKISSKSDSNIMFLDVDEFWFSNKFNQKIDEFVDGIDFDVLSFNWVENGGDDTAFEPPFINKKIKPNKHTKPLINHRILKDIYSYRVHIPKIAREHIHLNGEFLPHIPHNHGISDVDVTLNHSAYILHRNIRSENEYISTLLRGNPDDEYSLKRNRSGFLSFDEELNYICDNIPDEYYLGLQEFISLSGIEADIEIARYNKFEKCQDLFSFSMKDIIKDKSVWTKSLQGTSYEKEFIKHILVHCDKVEFLVFIASFYYKRYPDLCYVVLAKAKSIRPQGPIISRLMSDIKVSLLK